MESEELSPADKRAFEDFVEFVNEFKNESDRAAVILGASKLDQLLGMILEKYLIPCTNSTDNLFSNNGPLGTFSAKIEMCFRLGLIDSAFCKSIHLARKIRNEFAHEVYGASLNNGAHKDRIKSLVTPIKENKSFKWFKEQFFENVEDARADFSTAMGLMVTRLEGLLERVEPLTTKKAQELIPK